MRIEASSMHSASEITDGNKEMTSFANTASDDDSSSIQSDVSMTGFGGGTTTGGDTEHGDVVGGDSAHTSITARMMKRHNNKNNKKGGSRNSRSATNRTSPPSTTSSSGAETTDPSSSNAGHTNNSYYGVRCTILMILFLGAATSSAFIWIGVSSERAQNEDEFTRSAADSTAKIHSAFEDYVTAASLVHARCRHRNFTRADFRETYEYLIESGLRFKAVQFDPNITHDEREAAEAEARAYYAQHYPHVDYQGIRGFNTLNSTTLEPRTPQPFYFPIHYQEPIPGNEAAIDLDYHSSESRIRAVRALFDTGRPSLTDRLSLVKKKGSVSRCGNHNGPSYGVVLMHPGVNLTRPRESDQVWPRDFSTIVLCVPDLLRRSTVDQSKSALVYIHDRSHPSGKPVFLGGARVTAREEDEDNEDSDNDEPPQISFLDEVSMEELHHSKIELLQRRNVTAANRVWTVTVMAADDTYDANHVFVILGGCLIMVGSMLMAFWVYNNARRTARYNRVVQKMERSTAIVGSMFPKNVARRMMEELDNERNDATAAGAEDGSVASSLTRYDKNERKTKGTKIESKPIADLFPETTVMFADMEGFTAWSSMRDPISVFHLLETIYSAFDSLADKSNVFKVETVGDCYVAVCGLPEPNEAHAEIMARFAHNCCQRLAYVTSKLQVRLGPETSNLGFRFGLHSGPVTGGVLRGQRARFQLFGDAVNTAARIESTGTKGRIHMSMTTAALLRERGKGHWVIPREEMVLAKGIGMLQTCWLEIKPQAYSGSTSGGSIGGSIGDQFHHHHHGADEMSEGWADHELVTDKDAGLVSWHTEMLASFLKVIVAQQEVTKMVPSHDASLEALEKTITNQDTNPIDQMTGSLTFPEMEMVEQTILASESVVLSRVVLEQLRNFVTCIAAVYNKNPFHNFEHASHVVISVVKLLNSMNMSNDTKDTLNDPLARFTLVLASVAHDIDHQGVPNEQLIKENASVAVLYEGKSVAEQNSLDICWGLLMQDEHKELRRTIYKTDLDLLRFREYFVHAVLVTDIVNKDLQTKRKERWNKVFGAAPGTTTQPALPESAPTAEDDEYDSEFERLNTRKTALLELVIQASDVSHTMQHWHIFRQHNTCLYREIHDAYKAGRGSTDPNEGWYNGEIGFFKFYVIPLAERVKQSKACGALGEELYHYACSNVNEWEMKGKDIVVELGASVQKPVPGSWLDKGAERVTHMTKEEAEFRESIMQRLTLRSHTGMSTTNHSCSSHHRSSSLPSGSFHSDCSDHHGSESSTVNV